MAARRNKKKHPKKKTKSTARRRARAAKKRAPKKKRDLTKTPGLEKRLFSKIKQEYHDIEEYSFPMQKKDERWLSQFMEEHLGANIDEGRIKEVYNRKPMHKTKADRKHCYGPNNARQRDVYGLARATGTISDTIDEEPRNYHLAEDHFIALLGVESEILTKKEFLDLQHTMTEESVHFYRKHYGIK